MTASELESNPKYLVVDDEIVKEKQKKAFISPTQLPIEAGIFVESYDEALEALRANSNIIFCFVDLRIPLNKQEKYEKDGKDFKKWPELAREIIELKNENGVKLLENIQNINTYIFSAYAEKSSLKNVADTYSNIVKGCFEKPAIPEAIQKEIEPYLKYFHQQTPIPLPTKSFDYSILDDETSSYVRTRTIKIKELVKKTTKDIIDIGNYIIEVKNKLEYGNFYKWLESEFNWKSRTAARFMSVAQRFTYDSLSEIDILPTALYVLAPSTVPEEAVSEALERAKQGEVIGGKTAEEIKAKYKKLKEQAESEVQSQRSEEKSERKEAENKESILTISSAPQPSSLLLEKDKVKQKILSVIPSENAVKNSWWQLGENNRLFCGEPKSNEFIKRLPKDIGLSITFLSEDDYLIPPIKSIFSFAFQSKYSDLVMEHMVEESFRTGSQPNEIVVFCYIYQPELLDLADKYNCNFWVAEPDLAKCERFITKWREKGSVMRIKT